MSTARELDRERAYLAHLYEVIDEQRRRSTATLAQVLLDRQTGRQATFERDRLSESISTRLERLGTQLDGLCFGKLVATGTNTTHYIGRCAVADDEGEALLVDWRAPAAEPFYRATSGDPMGMSLRRHLIMSGRDLIAIEDDLLSSDSITDETASTLVGEAALLVALNRERTGHMGDIVATIQRDQDQIIRAPLKSTLVITGGPGTGKTVVALHRAAYLLFTHRAQIADDGVLLVGPSSLFLRYIERVLPSLGESKVVMIDWSELLPGIEAQPDTDPVAAELKGSLAMIEVMRRAVRLLERAPRDGVRVIGPNGRTMRLDHEAIKRSRRVAIDTGLPHNRARSHFERSLQQEAGLHDAVDSRHTEVSRRSINETADRLWPVLDPEDVLSILLANETVLAEAARGVLEPTAHQCLLRPVDAAWTTSDLPLLDELRELLGPVPGRTTRPARSDSTTEVANAGIMISGLESAYSARDGVGLDVAGIVNAEALVARYAERPREPSMVEQARRDPTWRFAHIVVDEAQDVSPMQWRALARRGRKNSMTIVGDPDQMSRPSDVPWIDRITSGLGIETCEERSLDVNYRTPAEVVRPAQRLRARFSSGTPVGTTRYVRAGTTPWATRCEVLDEATVRTAVERAQRELGDRGRIAVISSSHDAALVTASLRQTTGSDSPSGADRLTRSVAAYLADEVKGLEFDSVVVIDPEAIIDEYGWRQLYVVMTRPTTSLGLVVVGEPTDYEAEWLAEP